MCLLIFFFLNLRSYLFAISEFDESFTSDKIKDRHGSYFCLLSCLNDKLLETRSSCLEVIFTFTLETWLTVEGVYTVFRWEYPVKAIVRRFVMQWFIGIILSQERMLKWLYMMIW